MRSAPRSPPPPRPLLPAGTRGPLLVAAATALYVLLTLSPSGWGPGIACDEGYYCFVGRGYVQAWQRQGLDLFAPAMVERMMGFPEGGPPPHPPLAPWLFGWAQWAIDPSPDDPALFVPAARVVTAISFVSLVLLTGLYMSARAGETAGTVAALAVSLFPRLQGHARLVELDMPATFFSMAAVLALAEAERTGLTRRRMLLAGMVWGLAMLVKLNGLLLIVPCGLWLLGRVVVQARTVHLPDGQQSKPPLFQRLRPMVAPVLLWLGGGAAVFLAGWPWIWYDGRRLLRYVWSGANRLELHNFYLGQVYVDTQTPWHYPWVMLLVTLPLGFLLLAIWGLAACRGPQAQPAWRLLLANLLFLLLLFSLPGVPKYDGERLFLLVYPLTACFCGLGAARLLDLAIWRRWPAPLRHGALAMLLLAQGIGVAFYHPYHLSYYNLLAGGLPGAQRLGFEICYWGESVRGALLAEAVRQPVAGRLWFGPDLAPYQTPALQISQPALYENQVILVPWSATADRESADQVAQHDRYVIVYHRRADRDRVQDVLDQGEIVSETALAGVWLARLYKLSPSRPQPDPLRSLP